MPPSTDSPVVPSLPSFKEDFGGNLSIALQYALISLLAFVISFYSVSALQGGPSSLQMTGAMWAMISGILVLQDTRKSTLDTATRRIYGSFIGAVMGALYLLCFPFNPLGMAFMIGVTVLLCLTFRISQHAKLAALTVGVILIFSQISPDQSPLVNASLRFCEVIIGCIMAVMIEWIWPYLLGNRKDMVNS